MWYATAFSVLVISLLVSAPQLLKDVNVNHLEYSQERLLVLMILLLYFIDIYSNEGVYTPKYFYFICWNMQRYRLTEERLVQPRQTVAFNENIYLMQCA